MTEQEHRSYVIAIDYNEQYRTTNRFMAKAVYNLVDEDFEREVDGMRKQLIQVEPNGWESKVLFEDVIHCPSKVCHEIGEEDDDVEEEPQVRRTFHR